MPTIAPGAEQKHVLPNGVRVLLEELPHVHSAAIGFWIDTGSQNERPENNGVSHFIEHMLFKGTHSRTALDIARSLEDTGGSLNAFTDKEHTCFYARVLAQDVPLALDVLSDMIMNSLFDPKELSRERKVVLEEIKMYEDAPDELVQDLFSTAFWGDHPLAWPIVGTRTSMRGVSRDMVLDYMRHFYAPERLVVSVVGSFDSQAVLDQLNATVGQMESRPSQWVQTAPQPRRALKVKYKDIEQVHVCLGTEGVTLNHPDRFAVMLLDAILGGGMSSRLFQEVREKRGLAYTISSYELMYSMAGVFGIYAGCSPKHLEEVLTLSIAEIDKAKAGDLTEEELVRAKQQLKGSLLLGLESPRTRMNRMARNELFFGRLVTPDEVTAAFEAVTLADLTRVARSMLTPDTLTATVVGPVRKVKVPEIAA